FLADSAGTSSLPGKSILLPTHFGRLPMKLFFFVFALIWTTSLYSQNSEFPQWNQNPRSRNSLGNLQSYLQGQVLNIDGSPANGITVRITGANGTQASTT